MLLLRALAGGDGTRNPGQHSNQLSYPARAQNAYSNLFSQKMRRRKSRKWRRRRMGGGIDIYFTVTVC